MSQAEKAALYHELQDAGVEFNRHYRDYTEAELRDMVTQIRTGDPEIVQTWAPEANPVDITALLEQNARLAAALEATRTGQPVVPKTDKEQPATGGPIIDRDQHAGMRLNTKGEDEPIRTDENGIIWYQDEIVKSAFPKPRARRVLDYTETGSKTVSVRNGEYTESFEMPGEERRAAQVKITLPPSQVGIYRDPNLPFRIHTYQGTRVYDLFEVENYYGGADLVPAGVKRSYAGTALGYDISTVNREIESEARRLGVLGGMTR